MLRLDVKKRKALTPNQGFFSVTAHRGIFIHIKGEK